MKSKIKAAIFDYDGTVLDSMGMWGSASSNYVRTVLGKEPAADIDEVVKRLSLEEGAKIFRDEYGAEGSDDDIVAAVLETVTEQYRTVLPLKGSILNVLEDLKAHGIRMCVATASAREMIEAGNKRLGLDKYFEKIFTCMEIGVNKRKPDIYHQAAAYFGTLPEETLVFEDVLHAAVTASEAGYRLIGIYDEGSAADRDEIKSLSSFFMDSYDEWPGIENLDRYCDECVDKER
jgi:HAD superfamily hydrolase (TIGR01509 family)